MTTMTFKMCQAALVATIFVSSSIAVAAPSVGSLQMQRAFAAAAKGPDELRWFVQRTRMAYGLNCFEVANLYETTKSASAESATPVVAEASAHVR